MDKLIAIVTGPERNGTTYLKNLLDSHPNIFSGFETGFLIDDDFSKSIPWSDYVIQGNYHWGLPKNINLTDKNLTITDKYKLLLDNKGSYEGHIQNLIRKSTHIVDKTPAYFRILPQVCDRINNKSIPIIITIKYFQDYYTSLMKRDATEKSFLKLVNQNIEVMIWLKQNKNKLKNIYLFCYEDIIKRRFVRNLKQIIGKRINTMSEMSFEKYEEKINGIKTGNPYFNWKPSKLKEIPENLKVLEIKYNRLIDELKEKV